MQVYWDGEAPFDSEVKHPAPASSTEIQIDVMAQVVVATGDHYVEENENIAQILHQSEAIAIASINNNMIENVHCNCGNTDLSDNSE